MNRKTRVFGAATACIPPVSAGANKRRTTKSKIRRAVRRQGMSVFPTGNRDGVFLEVKDKFGTTG